MEYDEIELDQFDRRDRNTRFLLKYAHSCQWFYAHKLDAFVSLYRDMKWKPSFYHLTISRTKMWHFSHETKFGTPCTFLRGVTDLDLTDVVKMNYAPPPEEELQIFFETFRGVKKLGLRLSPDVFIHPRFYDNLRTVQELKLLCADLSKLAEDASENFRAVKSMHLVDCILPSNPALFKQVKELELMECDLSVLPSNFYRTLRGITSLKLICCKSDRHHCLFQNMRDLRGIKRLAVEELNISCSAGWEKELRGIEELIIINCTVEDCVELTDESFKNLRGVEKLNLSCFRHYENITDAAFMNLRGVKELHLVNIPHVIAAVFKELRGIEILVMDECPSVCCDENLLSDLQGIRVLKLHSGSVSSLRDETFRFFGNCRELHLKCDDGFNGKPLSEIAFSYLTRIRDVRLEGLNLEGIDSFQQMFDECMPEMEHFVVKRCNGGCSLEEFDFVDEPILEFSYDVKNDVRM